MLDAADQSVLAGPYIVPEEDTFVPAELAWMEDNSFAVGFWKDGPADEVYRSTLYKVEEEPQQGVDVPADCFFPVTTSSNQVGGKKVEIEEDSGSLEIESTNHGFGCDN